MNILTLLKKKEGALHWYGQRISAIIIAPFVLFFVFQTSMLLSSSTSLLEVILNVKNAYPLALMSTMILIVWHGITGIESILDDYVHNEKTKFVAYTVTKLIGLLIIKNSYLFICL